MTQPTTRQIKQQHLRRKYRRSSLKCHHRAMRRATIESSANRLYDISTESSWLVQETVAYTALAESFQEVTLQLASHAREMDLEACEHTYIKLTESCVKCHDYLREEALQRQMPGRITQQHAPAPILSALEVHPPIPG